MRLIDADALIEYMGARVFDLREMYGSYDHYTDGYEAALCVAENAHTIDAVSVVRCKECKTYSNGTCWIMRGKMKPDDFCSYGERRSESDV